MNILEKIKDKLLKDQKYTIVFFGDSTISTEWVHPNTREIIEYVLKDTLEKTMQDWRLPNWNIRFINAALNGGSTKDFLKYMVSEIDDYKPDMVILIGGDNDLEDNEIIDDIHANNLNKILTFLKSRVEDVVYATALYHALIPNRNTRYLKFLEKIKNLEILKSIHFINLYDFFNYEESNRFFTFKLSKEEAYLFNLREGDIDPSHMNQLGQAYVASRILKEIFNIEFDPEKYIKTNNLGYKYPEY